jgi:IclR family transcriptional regulator, pca regulon regulatory protein
MFGMRTSVHMLDQAAARNPDYVQSLERGLSVIRAFGSDNPELRLSDVARATGLTRAAARRFLLTLVRLGYVRQDGPSFSLRPRVLELGYAYLSALSLPEVAQPHMEALVGEVNESSSVAVLDDVDIVYVARVPTQRIMTITIAVGTRLPAYATSMGRVLLAGLAPDALADRLERIDVERLTTTTVPNRKTLREKIDEVRETGWAAVDQELEEGVRSAAVPIRDASQSVVAALNVSVHATRMTMQGLRRGVVPRLLRTAEAIEVDLRARGWESAVR